MLTNAKSERVIHVPMAVYICLVPPFCFFDIVSISLKILQDPSDSDN